MKTRRATAGVMRAMSVAGVWALAVCVSGVTAAASPSSAPSAMTWDADRFRFHEELVKAQKAVWDFQERLRATGVPADTRNLFKTWGRLLYQDSLRVGIGRLPAGDPAARELGAALLANGEPQIEMVRKANLGPIPESRIITLLTRVAALPGNPALPEAQWMASEFEHLFQKAKQRSDGFYMSEMKDLFGSPEPLQAKIDFVAHFVAIRDVAMAEYPREYFEDLLQTNTLPPDQRTNVQTLLNEIMSLRGP